jgi:hypothetical protein
MVLLWLPLLELLCLVKKQALQGTRERPAKKHSSSMLQVGAPDLEVGPQTLSPSIGTSRAGVSMIEPSAVWINDFLAGW